MRTSITSSSLHQLLGISPQTPLSIDGMIRKIRPAIYPAPLLTPRLTAFCNALREAFQALEISVLSEDEASGSDGRFVAGTVIFAPGIFPDDLLAINRVSTLYNNIIVGIYDEPAPLSSDSLPQERLDAIVRRLARDMVHILIFLTAESWTICTMNGGVVSFPSALPAIEDVRCTLVPKLTAQVVPPRPEDIDILQGELQTDSPIFGSVARDFLNCSALWQENAALLTHTSTGDLEYRSGFYKRIVARYLDQRSGMSYGFFGRQLPVAIGPAARCHESVTAEGHVQITMGGECYLVAVPEVKVITTRSGCRKHQLEAQHDLVEIGIRNGRAYMKTPKGLSGAEEIGAVRPSFDTFTILAHALGNAFTASILQRERPDAPFAVHLARIGASMTHWHGYPDAGELPAGYHMHGRDNPPVSCSTPQSAAYSLLGKITALEAAMEKGEEYCGDVHIEPNHGTNIVGILSLTETAALMNPSCIAETP
ncbi:MAG: hypothetical protein WCH05_03830 [Chlorobiaceae bacterium]